MIDVSSLKQVLSILSTRDQDLSGQALGPIQHSKKIMYYLSFFMLEWHHDLYRTFIIFRKKV